LAIAACAHVVRQKLLDRHTNQPSRGRCKVCHQNGSVTRIDIAAGVIEETAAIVAISRRVW